MVRRGLVVTLVGAGAMGIVIAYWLGDRAEGRTPVDRVTGLAYVNGNGDAIGLDDAPLNYAGFDVTGAFGRECLVPGGSDQPVELGVVNVRPESDAPGMSVAVWVKCLGPPKHFRPRDTLIPLTKEQRSELRDLPQPGERVEYVSDTPYLGSRSETAGIPDVQPGQPGRVLVLKYPYWIVVDWEGGPTLAMLPDSVRAID